MTAALLRLPLIAAAAVLALLVLRDPHGAYLAASRELARLGQDVKGARP